MHSSSLPCRGGLGGGVSIFISAIFLVQQIEHSVSEERDCFFWFARHGHNLTGVSPERGLIAASTQPKARVSIARWNLKEAGGKALA